MIQAKQHNLVYQITNNSTGKIYIGRHITDDLNDGYMGSGNLLKAEMKKWGRENFTKTILFDFDDPIKMCEKEIELLSEEFVKRKDNYNLAMGAKSGYTWTHGEEAREKLRIANTGFLTAIDKDGNTMRVSKDDPRFESGELKYMFAGKTAVRDKDGNVFMVELDDPRYLSGELISNKVGTKRPKETTEKHRETMIEYWKENRHTDEAKDKMRKANVGRVTVRDKEGNTFRVSVDDERYLSGELVCAYTGTKQSEEQRKKNSANKKGCVWISHLELKKTKLIKPEKLAEFIADGWIKGFVTSDRFDAMKEAINNNITIRGLSIGI